MNDDDKTSEPIDPALAPTEPDIPVEEARPVGEQLCRLLLVFGELSGKHPPIPR